MHARTLAILFAIGLAVGSAPAAYAAEDSGDTFPLLKPQDTERLREAGENACRDMMGSALQLGEKFRMLGLEMLRFMEQAGEELANEMAPAMREFADRLDEMARRLERRDRHVPETI